MSCFARYSPWRSSIQPGYSAGSALTLVNGTASPIVRTNTNTTISLPLSGAYGLTKDGPAMLTLSGDCSLTGALNVDTANGTSDDGVLRIANPDALNSFTSIAIRNNNSGKSRLELDGASREITSKLGNGVEYFNTVCTKVPSLNGRETLAVW